MANRVTTAVWYPGVRGVPAKGIIPYAQRLEAAGVDQVFTWDFLSGILPRVAWRDSFSPVASMLPDGDSFYDHVALLGLAGGATQNLGLSVVATNGIRTGPAEMYRMAMTLADASGGNSVVTLGTGEKQNTVPFGYKRSEGLARLEDHFRLYQLLWERDEPFSFEGNIWKYTNAYIGTARTHRPKMWIAGAKEKALDIAARYADGWLTVVPAAYAHVEDYAKTVQEVRRKVESYGRDPDQFSFGVEAIALVHEDEQAIQNAIDHSEFVTCFSSIYGRMAHQEWEREPDVELVRPRDYNYTFNLLPNDVTEQEHYAVMAKVSRAMKEKSFVHGNAKQVAAHWQGYVDAGATWVGFLDFAPFVFGLEDAGNCLERNIEVCQLLQS
jgi:phthiodiolone/phenolphthiodiolone dimycocerosates ketoreductase